MTQGQNVMFHPSCAEIGKKLWGFDWGFSLRVQKLIKEIKPAPKKLYFRISGTTADFDIVIERLQGDVSLIIHSINRIEPDISKKFRC